jgi:hypothetical protein
MPFFTLHEFNRVLKPGGTIYIEVPAPNVDIMHENNINHYSVLGASSWYSLINRSGYKNIESTEIAFKSDIGKDKYYRFIATK